MASIHLCMPDALITSAIALLAYQCVMLIRSIILAITPLMTCIRFIWDALRLCATVPGKHLVCFVHLRMLNSPIADAAALLAH